jgi:hypothetical protein
LSYEERKTLFIFLDESGNLDFSPKGSRFWSLTALCTFEPVHGRESLLHLRYGLADEGIGLECFHAAEDKQEIRDRVFECIHLMPDKFQVHAIIAEKRKTHPSLYRRHILKKSGKKLGMKLVRDESPFYDRVCRVLLRYIFDLPRFSYAEKIVVVLSSIFNKEKHSAIEGTLKSYLKECTKKPFAIYFHQNKADLNCQIADYCGWAIAIKWERQEFRSYKLVAPRVRSEFEIFRTGTKYFY